MKRATLALALLLLALPSGALAKEETGLAAVRYPAPFERIAKDALAAAEADLAARGPDARGRADLADLLAKARAHAEASPMRAHLVLIGVENYRFSARSYDVWTNASAIEDGKPRKDHVIAAGEVDRRAAFERYQALRAEMKTIERDLTSVSAFEYALHAADLAIQAREGLSRFDDVRVGFLQEANASETLAFELAAASRLPLAKLDLAARFLAEARLHEGEGVPINRTQLEGLAAAAWDIGRQPSQSEQMKQHEAILASTAQGNDVILGLAAYFRLLEADRAFGIATMFGDGASRGLDITNDMREGMEYALANVNVTLLRAKGFEGIWAVARIDQMAELLALDAVHTWAVAWAGVQTLDVFAPYVATISTAPDPSPSKDSPPAPGTRAPGPSLALTVGAVAVAAGALVASRRRAGP